MIATKNHTIFKSWVDDEFNSVVFKSVYKNCAFMERLIEKENLTLDQMNLEQMDVYWNDAKQICSNLNN